MMRERLFYWESRLCFFLGLAFLSATGAAQTQGVEKFEQVRVYLEQNLRDKDAEVKFDAVGTEVGLATLTVTAPDGRVVLDFKATNTKLGMRHFTLESPEPKNDGRLQKDFPEGVYKFVGNTVSGVKLEGQATLSHKFPAPASFVRPREDERNVPLRGLKINWGAVKATSATVVVIEHEKSGRSMRVNLPGDATTFSVPDGFLLPGTEYKLGIGTVAADGNASFIETGFTTTGALKTTASSGSTVSLSKGGGKVISEDSAKEIAMKALPGKAINIAVEKVKGVNRYVVEVAPTAGGKEWDVVIDMVSGKVLAVEK